MPRPAFTLLEIIIVMAIIAVIAALTVPAIGVWYADQHMRDAADMIRSKWALARSRAVNDGVPYDFGVVWNQSNWRIAPDGSEYWGSGGSPTPGTVTSPDGKSNYITDAGKLPHNLQFGSADSPASEAPSPEPAQVDASDYVTVVTFYPDGTVKCFMPDGSSVDILEISLAGTDSPRSLTLSLRAMTGVAQTRWSTAGKN